MEKKPYVRKQLIINKDFQRKFIIKAIFPLLTFVIFISVGFYFVLAYLEQNLHFENTSELILKISEGLGTDYTSEKLLASVRNYGYLFIFLFALLSALYLGYIFLFFSHRIAGPIYRFEHTLHEILNGNLNVEIKLRSKDEFQETAEQFNLMTRALRDRIRRIDQLSDYAEKQVKEMLEKEENPETKAKLEKTLDLIEGIREALSQFQV